LDSQREEERITEAGRADGGLTLGAVAAIGGVIVLAALVAFALFGGGGG
jgi:hypothetical protein